MNDLICAAVCLAVFCLVTAATSAAVATAFPWLQRRFASLSPRRRAAALFAAAISPCAAGLAVVLGVALPAFLLFEPRGAEETVGPQLPLLAAAGLLWIAIAGARALRLEWQTLQAEREWRRHATPAARLGGALQVEGGPLLGTVGLVHPHVYASRQLVDSLTAAELAATLAHEAGHIRAADNLKRLLLYVAPGSSWLRSLRREWGRACEVAADDAAVESGAGALDLASALVKAGRLRLNARDARPALASHLVPPGAEAQLAERVRHLRELLESDAAAPGSRRNSRRWWWLGLAVPLLAYAVYFMPLMQSAHEVIERLVR